jgi:hypothetical protein
MRYWSVSWYPLTLTNDQLFHNILLSYILIPQPVAVRKSTSPISCHIIGSILPVAH